MSRIADLTRFPQDGSYSVSLAGRPLLVVRRRSAWFVYANRCPHTGESLDPMGGSVASEDGLLLTCQRHAAQFVAATGECVGGPCQGQFLEPVPFTVTNDGLYLD